MKKGKKSFHRLQPSLVGKDHHRCTKECLQPFGRVSFTPISRQVYIGYWFTVMFIVDGFVCPLSRSHN